MICIKFVFIFLVSWLFVRECLQ